MSLPTPINWIRSSDYFARPTWIFIWNLMVPDKVIDDYYDEPIYYYPDTETGFDSVWGQFAFEVSSSRIMEFGEILLP